MKRVDGIWQTACDNCDDSGMSLLALMDGVILQRWQIPPSAIWKRVRDGSRTNYNTMRTLAADTPPPPKVTLPSVICNNRQHLPLS